MNRSYLLLGIAIIGLSCLGVFSILAVVFGRPNAADNEKIIWQIVSILSPTIIALVGVFKSVEIEKTVTTKVTDLKTSVQGNAEHLEKQAVKVADLNEKVNTARVTADIAAKTAGVLADKVNKLNGA